MRARKGGGRHVFTEPGPDAFKKPDPIKPAPIETQSIGPRPIQPSEIKVVTPRPPERLCPHGGVYLYGVAICQKCGGKDETELMGYALLRVCYKAAKLVHVSSSTLHDSAMTAMMELIKPKNEKTILTATSPDAMATVIAKRAILKLYRDSSVHSLAVSQFKFPTDTSKNELTTTGRLGWLADRKNEDGDTRAEEELREDVLDRIKVLPGVDLLWTSENLRWLRGAIDEAKQAVPKKPFDHWLVIDMVVGFSPDMDGEMTWADIAKVLSSQGREIQEWEVQAAYRNGRRKFKESLIEKLKVRNGS